MCKTLVAHTRLFLLWIWFCLCYKWNRRDVSRESTKKILPVSAQAFLSTTLIPIYRAITHFKKKVGLQIYSTKYKIYDTKIISLDSKEVSNSIILVIYILYFVDQISSQSFFLEIHNYHVNRYRGCTLFFCFFQSIKKPKNLFSQLKSN
jgi:hypothetical protein